MAHSVYAILIDVAYKYTQKPRFSAAVSVGDSDNISQYFSNTYKVITISKRRCNRLLMLWIMTVTFWDIGDGTQH